MSFRLLRGLGDAAATHRGAPVPEPSASAPLDTGVLSLCALRWRRSARSQTSLKSRPPTLEPFGGSGWKPVALTGASCSPSPAAAH